MSTLSLKRRILEDYPDVKRRLLVAEAKLYSCNQVLRRIFEEKGVWEMLDGKDQETIKELLGE